MSIVNETLMGRGSWNIGLKNLPDDLIEQLGALGHIIITNSSLDPRLVGDAGMLASSRYTGVLTSNPDVGEDETLIQGVGLWWWARDGEGKGEIIENDAPITFTADTLADCVTALLPDALTAGTLNVVAGAYTGVHRLQTKGEVIDYITKLFPDGAGGYCEWRVNPDGTLDVGTIAQLYGATPTALVVRDGGYDPNIHSIKVKRLRSEQNAKPYTTRVVLVGEGSGIELAIGEADISPATPYFDLHGNAVQRTRIVNESLTEAANVDDRAAQHLELYSSFHDTIDLSTGYEIEGTIELGKWVYVYEPPRHYNTDNKVFFRGQTLHPATYRVSGISWPIVNGMHVYYRPSLAAPTGADYIDITEWVNFHTEDKMTIVQIGDSDQKLLPAQNLELYGRVHSGSLSPTTVPNAPTAGVVASSGVYATAAEKVRGYIQLEWDAPTTNTDGSDLLDAQDFRIYYRVQHANSNPSAYTLFKNAAAAGTDPPTSRVFDKEAYDAPGGRTLQYTYPDLLAGASYASCRVDLDAKSHTAGATKHYTVWLANDQAWNATTMAANLDVEVRDSGGVLRATLVSTGNSFADTDTFHEFYVNWENDTGADKTTHIAVSKAVAAGVWATDVIVKFAEPSMIKSIDRKFEHTTVPWLDEEVMLDGLVPSAVYQIGIKARDIHGNLSSVFSLVGKANDLRPAAPQTCAAASDASLVYVSNGKRYGGFSATWTQALNSDGSAIEDGDKTIVRFRRNGTTSWHTQRVNWDDPSTDPEQHTQLGLIIGATYDVQVTTYDLNGHKSPVSNTDTVVIADDATAPSTPAAPTVSWSRVGQRIKVRHDLTKAGGGSLEDDLNRLLYYICTDIEYAANGNVVPTNADHYAGTELCGWEDIGDEEIVHGISRYGKGAPTDLAKQTQYWVAVIARDRAGNRSGVSVADTCSIAQLVNADEFGSGTVPSDVDLTVGSAAGDASLWKSANYNGTLDGNGRLNLDGTAGWALDGAGNLDAQAGRFRGTVYATAGEIGGWTIGATTLVGGDVALDAAGKITAGSGTDIAVLSGANPTYRMWIGAVLGADAPFKVTKAGAMTALSGVLGSLSVTGTLTLSGSGTTETAASGRRTVLANSPYVGLNFYIGTAGEDPGWVEPLKSVGAPPRLSLGSPIDPTYGKAASIGLVAASTGTFGSVELYGDQIVLGGRLVATTPLLLTGGTATYGVSLLGALTKVTIASDATISDATITTVSFDTEYRDTENWHLNGTNPSRITFDGPDGTTVQIKGIATFANNATGRRHILIYKNGTSIAQVNENAVNGAATRLNIAIDDYFDNGDYVEMKVYQNSGGNLALTAGVANTHFSLTVQ